MRGPVVGVGSALLLHLGAAASRADVGPLYGPDFRTVSPLHWVVAGLALGGAIVSAGLWLRRGRPSVVWWVALPLLLGLWALLLQDIAMEGTFGPLLAPLLLATLVVGGILGFALRRRGFSSTAAWRFYASFVLVSLAVAVVLSSTRFVRRPTFADFAREQSAAEAAAAPSPASPESPEP